MHDWVTVHVALNWQALGTFPEACPEKGWQTDDAAAFGLLDCLPSMQMAKLSGGQAHTTDEQLADIHAGWGVHESGVKGNM